MEQHPKRSRTEEPGTCCWSWFGKVYFFFKQPKTQNHGKNGGSNWYSEKTTLWPSPLQNPPWPEPEPMVRNEIQFLVGGNSNISYFHPVTLGRWFNLTYSIFSKWVGEKPPTLKNGPKKRFLERLPSVLHFLGNKMPIKTQHIVALKKKAQTAFQVGFFWGFGQNSISSFSPEAKVFVFQQLAVRTGGKRWGVPVESPEAKLAGDFS